jgi:hypothetical protein
MADEQGSGGFMERLRNSPRTVSTIIVILIIAGAIFAFSDRGSQTPASPTPEGEGEEQTSPTPTAEATAEADNENSEPAATVSPAPTSLPQPSETAEAYTEVAERGDGITHLARKAVKRQIAASAPDFQVTNEHRIFMEDYIKDGVGRTPLRVGESRAISKELVREAVDASKKLTDAQLKNLQTYSQRVQWE